MIIKVYYRADEEKRVDEELIERADYVERIYDDGTSYVVKNRHAKPCSDSTTLLPGEFRRLFPEVKP